MNNRKENCIYSLHGACVTRCVTCAYVDRMAGYREETRRKQSRGMEENVCGES
ncbi:MAG: hypothetical protein ACLVEV_08590 [Lachnospiraceae bacterium]|uniref:hypothetical protein n=1 Tax=Parablautia sp. Marseille-Q6255 TaxID=3039593 RepID=UPI0024BCC226|nr:hypothetical protein [Parablautia sp. Marseille-Q6255]